MPTRYTISVVNNSSSNREFWMFQKTPDTGDFKSLAWLNQAAQPGATTQFDWTDDYSVWAGTGQPTSGAVLAPTQMVPADLDNGGSVVLSQQDGTLQFSSPQPGAEPGARAVIPNPTVHDHTACLGIGMAGAGTFVCQAQPNTPNVFTPHPEYWVTFGQYKPGEVLDVDGITNTIPVDFPPDVYDMTVTLNADNTFTIQQ